MAPRETVTIRDKPAHHGRQQQDPGEDAENIEERDSGGDLFVGMLTLGRGSGSGGREWLAVAERRVFRRHGGCGWWWECGGGVFVVGEVASCNLRTDVRVRADPGFAVMTGTRGRPGCGIGTGESPRAGNNLFWMSGPGARANAVIMGWGMGWVGWVGRATGMVAGLSGMETGLA